MRFRLCLVLLTVTGLAGCGNGGVEGGGDAPNDNSAPVLTLTLVDENPVAGRSVPIMVSVHRNGEVDADYRGTITFTTNDPVGLHPTSCEFTEADGGERQFDEGFVFSGGQHVLFAEASEIDGVAELPLDVAEDDTPPAEPPPAPVPPEGPRYFYRVDPMIHRTAFTANQDVALADVDADGDQDLFLAGVGHTNTLWLNDGDGAFTLSPVQFVTGTARSALFGDVDADGDPDLVIAFDSQSLRSVEVWRNNGAGVFDRGPRIGHGTHIALHDLDGDTDLDLVLASPREVRVRLNDGTGGYPTLWQFFAVTPNQQRPALADLDGDGDADLIAGRAVYLNDGTGRFAPNGQTIELDTRAVAFGDMDGDGDLDVVTGNYGGSTQLYFNDGAANLTLSPNLVTAPFCTLDVALLDVDEDGDLDVIEGNASAFDHVFLNDGGAFVRLDEDVGGLQETMAFALGDIDGDGDADIVNAELTGAVRWFRND